MDTTKQIKLTDIFKRQNKTDDDSIQNSSISSVPIDSDSVVNIAVDEPVANQTTTKSTGALYLFMFDLYSPLIVKLSYCHLHLAFVSFR